MNNRKPMAFWLPSKCNDLIILILKLQYFNWYVSFFYTEKLKACVCAFFRFSIAFNINSKVVSIALPVDLAVTDTEKVFLPEFFLAGDLDQTYL